MVGSGRLIFGWLVIPLYHTSLVTFAVYLSFIHRPFAVPLLPMKHCTAHQFFANSTLCFLPFGCEYYFHYGLRARMPCNRAVSTSSRSYTLTPDSMSHPTSLHPAARDVIRPSRFSTLLNSSKAILPMDCNQSPWMPVTRLRGTIPIVIYCLFANRPPGISIMRMRGTLPTAILPITKESTSLLPNPTPRIPVTQLWGQGTYTLRFYSPTLAEWAMAVRDRVIVRVCAGFGR